MFVISLVANDLTTTTVVEVKSLQDLATLIENRSWSPYTFENNYRKNANFQKGDIFALDVDSDLSLEEAKERLIKLGWDALLSTSRNHRKEKGGVVADRFRIILPSKTSITSPVSVFEQLKREFPEADPSCKDKARLFYPSKPVWIQETGKRFEPIPDEGPSGISLNGRTPSPPPPSSLQTHPFLSKAPLSQKTLNFILQGAPQGERNRALIAACHDAIQQQWTEKEFLKLLRTQGQPWMTQPRELEKIQERFKNFKPTHAPRTVKTGTPPVTIAVDLIKQYLDQSRVQVGYDRSIRFPDAPLLFMSIPDLERKIRLHFYDINLHVSPTVITDVIKEWVEGARGAYLEAIKERIRFNTDAVELGEAELRRFIAALKADYSELDLAVWKHMIWQIKRKMWLRPTTYHMMLILEGGQGAGKSWALSQYFLKPLEALAHHSIKFNALEDERQARVLSDHFALVIDEMGGIEKASMESIKSIITQTTIKQRVMKTTEHVQFLMNATFFGTSNKPFQTLILDETGIRRFYPIWVDAAEKTRLRWPILDTIDYEAIWQSIDESCATAPILSHLNDLNKVQEMLRHKKPVEMFLYESGEVEIIEDITDEALFDTWMQAKQLHRMFNEWYGGRSYSMPAFFRELLSIKDVARRRNAKGCFYNVKVKNTGHLVAI